MAWKLILGFTLLVVVLIAVGAGLWKYKQDQDTAAAEAAKVKDTPAIKPVVAPPKKEITPPSRDDVPSYLPPPDPTAPP